MKRSIGRGLAVRLALAAGSAALFVITLVWHDWIEIIFGVDPDRGNGWLEWLIVLVAFGLTLAFSVSARQEWRRSASAAAAGDSAA
jgi:apolipoprotein N-acyltransferase